MAANVALLTRDDAQNVATLERAATPVAPTITTSALPGGRVGVAYSQVVQATGTPSPTASITNGALPAGLTLASATRRISGVPTTPVAATFDVTATNSAGSDVKALSILVPNEGAGGEAPTVTAITLVPTTADVLPGGTVDLTLMVEDQNGNGIANLTGVIVVENADVTAEQLAPTDAIGQATVRVTGATAGSCLVRVEVDGVSSNAVDVTVIDAVPPTITTTSLPPAVVGQPYSAQLVAVGTDPITWSIVSGSISPLILSGDTIVGTPTVEGTLNFVARADNPMGFAQQTFSIVVNAVAPTDQAPTNITLSASTVSENAANGTVVGAFTTTDADQASGHIYTLTDSAGGRFGISGDQLVVADGSLLDYESATQHSITVRTTDSGGLFFEKTFVVTVLQAASSATGVRLQLYARSGALRASITGISFMWWDAETPAGAPALEGTASIDADGWLQLALPSSILAPGQTGHLKLFKLGGNPDLDLHFSGRVATVTL